MTLSDRRRAMPAGVARAGHGRQYRSLCVKRPSGVNLAGYLTTESGMGEAARLSARSLEAAGIPLTLNNVASRLRMDDRTYTSFSDDNPYPFNLIHLNADNMEWFSHARGAQYFRTATRSDTGSGSCQNSAAIGCRPFGRRRSVGADQFSRAALEGRSPVPVTCMPLPRIAASAAVL